MQLRNIKIKIIFNNNTKINYISKNFANKINLVIRKNVFILLVEITRARVCFEEIIKDAKILIEKIIIYIFIFVIFRLNYKILLNRFF